MPTSAKHGSEMSATTRDAAPTIAYRAMEVRRVRRLTPRMLRISFAGDDLYDVDDRGPDQYVKLFFPLAGQRRPTLPEPSDLMSWYRTYLAMPDGIRPPMRTYTIRAMRPADGELDVDFVLHGPTGPASEWADTAKPGDEVVLAGPHGLYDVPPQADWQLLVGDETAIPAIGAIVERLAPNAVVRGFIEIPDASEKQEFASLGDVDLRWIVRDDNADEHGEAVLSALREAEFLPGEPYAWISGEATMVKFARRHLVREREVDKRSICFTGYWRQGKSEDEVGRENRRAADEGRTPERDDE